ncbi:hypothetical protein EI42_03944 [Thermosporothrix hazakensis]|jgi:hypothetical protein|uniref:Uncharacterized protein n=1 Tax=Thermosporothrix hazakensis TaxID=644383 RepID=A0A326U386_THEHA|nr:hypothetical protein [Thermosporothrix hazakensis]PZW26364.1 hypothetical protein EI42_03944 [Thermosporothrix hazakensis]GCE48684.1 hypothetical protein KTH_35530 [Thermosporothrix hazakensis]
MRNRKTLREGLRHVTAWQIRALALVLLVVIVGGGTQALTRALATRVSSEVQKPVVTQQEEEPRYQACLLVPTVDPLLKRVKIEQFPVVVSSPSQCEEPNK